ncbi:helix-turn-helix domain-containing protein [Dactylosporangium sp. NPDC051485]|uniref:helix-turn-helix domain-containing protein n=1 Tax=Dactylosporangium sp. NPDC051485 TaxID=3154846 RepID=UPI00342FF9DF
MAEPADESVTLRQWTDVVRRARLGRTVKAVALTLATYADNDGTRVYPGVARLAVDCELTYNVVQGALAALRAAGLIALVRRSSRRGQADEYRLILAADVLDRVEVLTPTQVAGAASTLAERRRGRHRPAPAVEEVGQVPEEVLVDLHPTKPGAAQPDERNLHPGASGAGCAASAAAAPHGIGREASAAPHGDVQLQPTALPPTPHGPNHNFHHPNDGAAVRTDVAVGGVSGQATPADPEGRDRCEHGLNGSTGIRCPACRRHLVAPSPLIHSADGRPRLRLVRSA